MILIAHISDLHVGAPNFKEDILLEAIRQINNLKPDVTVISGDLTDNGYYLEFLQAAEYLKDLRGPHIFVPGNHDARHVGNETFEEVFTYRKGTFTLDDLTIIGLDSSEPDLDYGKIGRSQQIWMEEELEKASRRNHRTVIALHHHIIPVPKTGRERNVLADAGDVLQSIINGAADLVISGHKHVPHAWRVEDTFFVTAGTVSSLKLRGKDINSYNTYYITDDSIRIVLNEVQGESRELASRSI
ncbi:metallophosphoesterase [Methanothermobacter wolfeii]|uniref:Metallophosphoesterase n=1 Tax=Methanothermobacter wolfeii TaxID=145261 RepID=A0A9E7UHH7_METWO|nr:metallophosphoesterase [Methanothermobacter wolfeii]UXH32299.1 metallophosphoesterase [Methanothermobacter wolfeii]SCM56587.1 3',5'-cyclic adenosine monophosphate phosphodiesterase CpdA {ECO:0000255/HAMAP-Rule:MF_00905} [Methanothermobacter wolfeii]